MCESNPTRYCSKRAKKIFLDAKENYLKISNEGNEALKYEAYSKLIDAQNNYEETTSGQQVLIRKIRKAEGSEKATLEGRQKSGIERRREKRRQAVINSGKICPKCKLHKPFNEFSPHKNNPDGFQKNCRGCRALTSKIYHDRTPEQTLSRRKSTIDRRKLVSDFVTPILKSGCVDCGNFHENAMDFDHIPERGKKAFNISDAHCGSFQDNEEMITRLKTELEKCEVRCSNCHRKVTLDRQPRNIRRMFKTNPEKFSGKKKIVMEFLSKSSCIDCKTDDLDVLEFDHVRDSKHLEVSKMVNSSAWTEQDVKNEIAKCDVRCANCHRKKTHEHRNDPSLSKQENKYKPKTHEVTCSCGNKKRLGSKVCNACNMRERASWPSTEILIEMLKDSSFEALGRSLGVSGNAIRKKLKSNGIDIKTVKTIRNNTPD